MKGKPERFLFCSDSHGDHICPHAAGVMLNFKRQWKPTIVIHGGDAFDMRSFRKGASDEEKRQSLQDDVDAGCAFLDKLKPTHFLRGNHDERWADALLSDDGGIADLANGFRPKIEAALEGVRVYPYHKRLGVFRYGDTSFLHGYQTGLYAARNAAAVYGKCVFGHVHSIDCASVPRLGGAVGRAAGALCKLDQPYNRTHVATLRQNHGFVYGLKHNGTLIIYQAESHNGTWFLPTEMHQVRSR